MSAIKALFAEISDLHIRSIEAPSGGLSICEDSVLVFPGPRPLQNSLEHNVAHRLLEQLAPVTRHEFTITFEGVTFRVQRSAQAIDGIWFRLRKMSDVAPTLETLPSRMPDPIEKILLQKQLSSGGIILVCGAPGSGKTTSAAAILVSRLQKFGGYAYTVEDPPEIISLNGRHGDGYCTQTQVYESESGWEDSIKEVLRSQPVGASLMLFVGEIRTPEAARMMIRAASNGFLVITTTFATDLISGIDTFHQLLGPDYASSFAASLRVVLYQRMHSEPFRRIEPSVIVSDGASSRVAVAIKMKQVGQLKDEIAYQANLIGRSAMAAKAAVNN